LLADIDFVVHPDSPTEVGPRVGRSDADPGGVLRAPNLR
jgi:hypothetical protein